MNSSSVPASASSRARRAGRAGARRIWRGEATTGEPSCHCEVGQAQRRARRATGRGAACEVGLHLEVAVAALPRATSRSRRPCSSRRRRRAGSCRPRRRARATSSRKCARCSRLPCRRPCMSVSASRTVSTSPLRTAVRSFVGERRAGLVERQQAPPWRAKVSAAHLRGKRGLDTFVTSGLASRPWPPSRSPAPQDDSADLAELRLRAVAPPPAALLQLVRRRVQLHLAGDRHLHAVHPRRRHARRRVHLDVPGGRARASSSWR